jgi:putative MATE family efflux protein
VALQSPSSEAQAWIDAWRARRESDTGVGTRELLNFIVAGMAVWTAGPILSIIDTSVVGLGSTLELAALGPATALADSSQYAFVFLSVATTSLVARALARGSTADAQRAVQDGLSVAFAAGCLLCLTLLVSAPTALMLWTGDASAQLVPPASTYVYLRALGMPVALVTSVAQAAFLATKQPLIPVVTVAIAAAVNALGDLLLCCVFHFGLAGAAAATTASQVVACGVIVSRLFASRVPSMQGQPLLVAPPAWLPSRGAVTRVLRVGLPVCTLVGLKIILFSCTLGGAATRLGPTSSAAHACLIAIYILAAVCGDAVSQAAQSYLPATLGRPTASARLCASLVGMGLVVGAVNSVWAGAASSLGPAMFTTDLSVMALVRHVTPVMCASLVIHTASMATEGALLAARDLKWLVASYAVNSLLCACSLRAVGAAGWGLWGVWLIMVQFHATRIAWNAWRLFVDGKSPIRATKPPPRDESL